MFKWASYPFVRFAIALILGISYYLYALPSNVFFWTTLLYALSLLYLIAFLLVRRRLRVRLNSLFGFLVAAILFSFGVVRAYYHTDTNDGTHVIHQLPTNDTINFYRANVIAKVQERKRSYRTLVNIRQVKIHEKWQEASGKVMFYIRKDSLTPEPKLHYGDVLLIKGSPRLLEEPKNPNQFNYKRYLALQNIYHQHFTTSLTYQKIGKAPSFYINVKAWAIRVGTYCSHQLKTLIDSPREAGIATALLLGVKDRLDQEVLEAYSGAGLMHLLAVSGLHVGFIFIVLSRVLGQVRKIPQGGPYLFAVIVIACLWFYAFVTGLSASVLRAVTMFSVMAIAKAINRRTPIYNSLAIAAFFLLIYDPFMLTSVGFQLSYLAVAGIVYMQPKIYQWVLAPNKALDYLWQITSVSIAAQIATFPLALYYFHQFPNYFLLSNILVLPLAELLLGTGIATVLFSFIPGLNLALGYLLKNLIATINTIIFSIDKLPAATSEGIYLRTAEMWLIYLSIIGFLLVFQRKKFHYLLFSVLCLLIFTSSRFYHQHLFTKQQRLTIFHLGKHAHIHFTKGIQGLFIGGKTLRNDRQTLSFNTATYLWSKGVQHNLFWNDRNSLTRPELGFAYRKKGKYALLGWQSTTFLILQQYMRSQELKPLQGVQTDYVIIQNRAVWSLEHLLKYIQPRYIIIDGSNGFYRGRKLSNEAKQLGLPCHWISTQGAFTLTHPTTRRIPE